MLADGPRPRHGPRRDLPTYRNHKEKEDHSGFFSGFPENMGRIPAGGAVVLIVLIVLIVPMRRRGHTDPEARHQSGGLVRGYFYRGHGPLPPGLRAPAAVYRGHGPLPQRDIGKLRQERAVPAMVVGAARVSGRWP